MSILIPGSTEVAPLSEDALFVTLGDITSEGNFGETRLEVTRNYATKFERGVEIARYELAKLGEPRVEDLVDASALVARYEGLDVELLRTTSPRNLRLAGAEKRLKAILEGKPMPDVEDKVHLCPRCARPLPDDTNVCENCVNRGKTLLRLFGYTKPFRWRLWWGTILTLAGTTCALLPPYLTLHLVDDVLRKGHSELFPWLIGSLIASQLLIQILAVARGRNVAYLGMRIAVSIRTSLFEKLQSLSLSFYDKRNVGSIMSRMTNDTGALYDVLIDGIPVLLNQLALLIGIPTALLLINWRIGIWVILPIPFVMLAVRWFRRRMTRVWNRHWHNWSRLGGALNGVLQGTRVVKAFHGEEREVVRFERRITTLAKTGYEAESSWSNFFPAIMFVMGLSTIVVWWIGGDAVLKGSMTLGQLTAFIGYVVMLQQPLMMLQRIIDWSSRALTAAERVFEVMDTPEDIVDDRHAVPMPAMKGSVKFTDVHFGYEKAREVLHGIDMDVKPGEMVGLVGHSGAGKSTLINLLLRFYDPTQGSIEIDGVDLRKIKLEDFRRQVGVVMQESYLFPGSIRDNIAYGRTDASLTEIIEAAQAANAHHFISNFPDGYDTYVGERGQRLSGGERQRIAIARAILHNPRILILDEATASVDTETERLIQEALEHLVSGRTTFAIAHRLSTLRNADRLNVIEDGRVAETGTHAELLEHPEGIYAKLVEMQLQMNKVSENFLEVTDHGE